MERPTGTRYSTSFFSLVCLVFFFILYFHNSLTELISISARGSCVYALVYPLIPFLSLFVSFVFVCTMLDYMMACVIEPTPILLPLLIFLSSSFRPGARWRSHDLHGWPGVPTRVPEPGKWRTPLLQRRPRAHIRAPAHGDGRSEPRGTQQPAQSRAGAQTRRLHGPPEEQVSSSALPPSITVSIPRQHERKLGEERTWTGTRALSRAIFFFFQNSLIATFFWQDSFIFMWFFFPNINFFHVHLQNNSVFFQQDFFPKSIYFYGFLNTFYIWFFSEFVFHMHFFKY